MALVIAMACAIAVMVIGGAVGFVAPVHMRCVRLGVPRGLSLVTHAASRDPHVGIPHNRPGDIAYRSPLLDSVYEYDEFVRLTRRNRGNDGDVDIFWEQIQYEASSALRIEPEAGPQLYQGILSQPSLLEAICTRIAHEIETELIPATEIKSLFLEMINPDDEQSIRLDLQAVATRTPSVENAMTALLFHNGYHALVAYRVGHRLWLAGRTGLAKYMQSTVSRKFSADIHPACRMGHGIYVRVGAGVVIGETAVLGNDVSILEGVTLGGTGKEAGDRHPKIGNGVIVQDGGSVLGNIVVGDGAVVTAKSIVTKPVPPLAIVCGVPAAIVNFRQLDDAEFDDDLQHHLKDKYRNEWKLLQSTKT